MSPAQPANESHLKAMAEAALGGHDLGPWEARENGWQAACRRCGLTSWIGRQGLRYSLLAGAGPGAAEPPAETEI